MDGFFDARRKPSRGSADSGDDQGGEARRGQRRVGIKGMAGASLDGGAVVVVAGKGSEEGNNAAAGVQALNASRHVRRRLIEIVGSGLSHHFLTRPVAPSDTINPPPADTLL